MRPEPGSVRLGVGFTLLEVLVSLALFSIIGVASFRLLTTVTDSFDQVSSLLDEHQALTLALSRLNRDLIQLYPRVVRDEYGEPLPPLMVQPGSASLEFTRLGWRNPAGYRRGQVQRLAYQVRGGELIRTFWQVTDRADTSEPGSQRLLQGVRSIRVEMLDGTGRQVSSWPSQDTEITSLPSELEVILDMERLGEIRRRILLIAIPADP